MTTPSLDALFGAATNESLGDGEQKIMEAFDAEVGRLAEANGVDLANLEPLSVPQSINIDGVTFQAPVSEPVIAGNGEAATAATITGKKPRKNARTPKPVNGGMPLPGAIELDLKPINPTQFVDDVKANHMPVKLSITAFGTRKTLDAGQKVVAANAFHANSKRIGASKLLFNMRNPAIVKVNRVLQEARRHWKESSIPFPEDGVRLIKKTRVVEFDAEMAGFKAELATAVAEVNALLPDLKSEAEADMGELYNAADYPDALAYGLDVGYPSVAVPEAMMQLSPMLYERECLKMQAMVQEGIRQHEQAMAEQLHAMTYSMMAKLSGLDDDGKPKVVRADVLSGFSKFFLNLKKTGVVNDPRLIDAIDMAQGALSGADLDTLREDDQFRQSLTANMQAVAAMLEESLVEKPTRSILIDDEEDDIDGGAADDESEQTAEQEVAEVTG